jgi:hypothetical protein
MPLPYFMMPPGRRQDQVPSPAARRFFFSTVWLSTLPNVRAAAKNT